LNISKFCDLLIREDDLRRVNHHFNNENSHGQEKRVMYTNNTNYNNEKGQKRKKYFKTYKSSKKFKKDDSYRNSNSNNKKFKYKYKSSLHNRICYNCRKKAHYAKDCRSPKSVTVPVEIQNRRNFVGNCKEENSNVNISQRGYVLFDNLACTTNLSDNLSDSSKKWLLDSGASMHICNNKSLFIDLVSENSSVLIRDNRQIQVSGRGTVKLSMAINGVINNLILQHVALVPNFAINLVSTGRLESVGFKIITERGISSLYFENELVGIAKRMTSNSYLYEFENCIKLSSNVVDNMALVNQSNNNEWSYSPIILK